VNGEGLINISGNDVNFIGNGRVITALHKLCGNNLSDIFVGMDKAFIECKEKYKNLATIISFSGQFGNEPIFEMIDNYFTHCSNDKILTDIPTEFGMYIKKYNNFSVKATLIIFAE
jgi:hypothetical protein